MEHRKTYKRGEHTKLLLIFTCLKLSEEVLRIDRWRIRRVVSCVRKPLWVEKHLYTIGINDNPMCAMHVHMDMDNLRRRALGNSILSPQDMSKLVAINFSRFLTKMGKFYNN